MESRLELKGEKFTRRVQTGVNGKLPLLGLSPAIIR